MLNKDVLSLLGLASRARLISTGDVLLKDIRNNRVYFCYDCFRCKWKYKEEI